MWGSVFDLIDSGYGFLLCITASIALGLIIAVLYMRRNSCTKRFAIMLVLLPPIVQAVIMLVNGNLGTGIAVLGAFSLIRFRSAPGKAVEIAYIFFAMAVGIALGMGYIAIAAGFTAIIGGVFLLLTGSRFGSGSPVEKRLRVTIPENLDYTGIFDDLFKEYTLASEMESVKTTNLGSLYELQYKIRLRDEVKEKEFLDKLRCRNGNLNIVCGKIAAGSYEL